MITGFIYSAIYSSCSKFLRWILVVLVKEEKKKLSQIEIVICTWNVLALPLHNVGFLLIDSCQCNICSKMSNSRKWMLKAAAVSRAHPTNPHSSSAADFRTSSGLHSDSWLCVCACVCVCVSKSEGVTGRQVGVGLKDVLTESIESPFFCHNRDINRDNNRVIASWGRCPVS